MKNNIYKYIFISRFRQASERKRNIIVCVAALLVGFMIALSSSVFMNTSKDNLDEIERVYGRFDVSIALSDVQNMDIVNQALKEYQYIIVQNSNELNDEYNLLVVNSIEDYLEYNNCIMSEGDIVISESISQNLGIYENDIYKLDGKEYRVAQVSEDINCILNNEKESILIDEYDQEWKNPIYLLYLNHETEEINAVQKKISEILKSEEYLISSNYNTYGSMLEDMRSLRGALLLFICIVIILSSFMIIHSYNNVISERMKYWNTLCCIGLSRKKMLQLIGIELAIYIGIGAFFGIALGNIGALLVCKFSDIKVFVTYPDLRTYFATFCVCLFNILVIVLLLKRKVQNISLSETTKMVRRDSLDIKSRVYIFLNRVFVVSAFFMFVIHLFVEESMGTSICTLVFCVMMLFVLIKWFCDAHMYLLKTRNSTLYLCGINMKSHCMLTKGMSVILTITFVILFLLSSVLHAYQQTAISAVERQLKYDLMAYGEGGTSEEVLRYIENYEYSVIYEDVGKINSLGNVYLCGLAETNILDIYSQDIFELKKWDSKIGKNEIVVSKYVANIYGIEIGDVVSILYGGKDYKLEVCNIINTNDFLSQVIYFDVENSSLSEEFCEDKTYYYFKGNSNEISELKKYFEDNNNFVYMDITEVKEQWIDNTSAALEPMRLFAGVISVSLLGITLCMLLSANREKKYDYSLMVMMGYRQKKIHRVVFIEIMSVILASMLFAFVFCLLCNSSVIYILSVLSNYELLSDNVWTQNLALILIIAVFAGVVVYGCSKKMMKQDIYNILVKGVEKC